MDFFSTKIALGWALAMAAVPLIAWLLLFLLGTGAYWEYNKMPLVDLEVDHRLVELYQKKVAALEDISRPEMAEAPSDSPVLKAKMDHLNSLEKIIARREGRLPVIYVRLKQTLGDTKLKAEGTVQNGK